MQKERIAKCYVLSVPVPLAIWILVIMEDDKCELNEGP